MLESSLPEKMPKPFFKRNQTSAPTAGGFHSPKVYFDQQIQSKSSIRLWCSMAFVKCDSVSVVSASETPTFPPGSLSTENLKPAKYEMMLAHWWTSSWRNSGSSEVACLV